MLPAPPRRQRPARLLHASPLKLLAHLGSLTGHAMLAWFVIAVPAVLLMTLTLTVCCAASPPWPQSETGDLTYSPRKDRAPGSALSSHAV